MESHSDQAEFAAELRALRPTPRPAFAAQLDARVAAGFAPPPAQDGSSLSRLAERARRRAAGLAGVRRRRLLVPAAAATAVAIAVATGVIAVSEGGSEKGPSIATAPGEAHRKARLIPFSADLPMNEKAVPASPSAGGARRSEALSAAAAASASGSQASSHLHFFDGAGRYVAPAIPAERNGAVALAHNENLNASAKLGPYAIGVAHRDIERSAQLVLGDGADEVRNDAAKVFEAVQAYHGIVLRSSIADGGEGQAGATFNLLVPSGKLGEAMAAFSSIADVRSRHETGVDVTAPTISLGERLQDARATVSSLVSEVAGAETGAEREAAEAKLRAARRQVAVLRSRLTTLRRNTHLSSVLLRIETGGDTGSGNGSWGVGDGLRQAGHILAVAAGVTVIVLAIVLPIALIALLAWLAARAWVRRSRERALD